MVKKREKGKRLERGKNNAEEGVIFELSSLVFDIWNKDLPTALCSVILPPFGLVYLNLYPMNWVRRRYKILGIRNLFPSNGKYLYTFIDGLIW